MTTYRYMGPNETAEIGAAQVAQGQTFEEADDAVIEAARQSGLQIDAVVAEATPAESPAPVESAGSFDPMGVASEPTAGNPAGGIHTEIAQDFADLSATDTGIHGAVEQSFAVTYGEAEAPAASEASAAPAAESPAA